MLYHHLTRKQKDLYNKTILQSHRRRIEVEITPLNGGQPSLSLTPMILSGQITLDVESMPMQVLTLSFVEPFFLIVFEPNTIVEGAMQRRHLIRVNDSRLIPGLGWIDCWVFTGPIWDFERQGITVTVTAHSVDQLAAGTIRKAKQWQRKVKKTNIIKDLLHEAGAVDIRIPDLAATTPVHVHIGVVHHKHRKPRKVRRKVGYELDRTDTYWDKAAALAHSMNRLLLPTGDGFIEMRSHPERPIYTFTHALLAEPDAKRPGEDGPNTWVVIGGKPRGAKKRVSSGLVGFPNSHPLSANALAWNGKPDQILEIIQNPHLKTKKECRAVAIRHRDKAARIVTDTSFDSLPIPWLRPWDMVIAQSDFYSTKLHLKQLTYPLTPDTSPMTVGAVRLATPTRRG